ncbi:hypothetical protein GCM10022397_02370 [Flavivirga jejuensis]
MFLSKANKPKIGVSYRTFLAKFTNWALGIRITQYGEIPDEKCLLVSNHRSYIDATVILCKNRAYAVSKKTVKGWPIIGYIASISGTIFIDRGNSTDRKKGLDGIKTVLSRNKSVLNFIQGTTTVENKIRETKNGSLVAAYNLGIPIYPISIDYLDKSNYWVGDDRFIPHFFRTFGKLTTKVRIIYHSKAEGENIDEVIFNVKKTINDGLGIYKID